MNTELNSTYDENLKTTRIRTGTAGGTLTRCRSTTTTCAFTGVHTERMS